MKRKAPSPSVSTPLRRSSRPTTQSSTTATNSYLSQPRLSTVAPLTSSSIGLTSATPRVRPMPPPLPNPPTTPYPGTAVSLATTVPRVRPMPPPLPSPPNGPPPTYYKIFLDSLVRKAPANLTRTEVNNWQDVDLTSDQGRITDEIAKKFNNQKRLGINNVGYATDPENSYYGVDQHTFSPGMYLSAQTKGDTARTSGPEPIAVGHELFHANDHQIDQLNPKVWGHLLNMAQGVNPHGAPPKPMAQSNFFNSIGKIKKKLDVEGQAFYDRYPMNLPVLAQEMSDATRTKYIIPTIPTRNKGKSMDWPSLSNHINGVATAPPSIPGGVPNSPFALSFGSEIPAYMSENLTRHWDTASAVPATRTSYGVPRLNVDEARVLYNTLGDMATAYPAPAYPATHTNIMARRNSLEQAHYPPSATNPTGGLAAGQQFFRGGHITKAKTKAKTKKRGGLFSYFND